MVSDIDELKSVYGSLEASYGADCSERRLV